MEHVNDMFKDKENHAGKRSRLCRENQHWQTNRLPKKEQKMH